MTIKESNISSIGWLNSCDGVVLTPVFVGSSFPVKVKISRVEFQEIRHSDSMMKGMACKKINTA